MARDENKSNNEARFHPLLARAISGDRKAYAQFLAGIARLARKYVSRKVNTHADAEDVVQEILLSIHKALPTYNPARPCMPWLGAIMHYRLNDWLRSRYHAAKHGEVAVEEIKNFFMDNVTEDPFINEYINNAVAALPEKQKTVLQAMYFQELTVSETSKKLGMSISAVKVTAHRAYKTLRERLK